MISQVHDYAIPKMKTLQRRDAEKYEKRGAKRLLVFLGAPLSLGVSALRGFRGCDTELSSFFRQLYRGESGLTSCKIVVAISSMDFAVDESQRMPSRFIMASASLTS